MELKGEALVRKYRLREIGLKYPALPARAHTCERCGLEVLPSIVLVSAGSLTLVCHPCEPEAEAGMPGACVACGGPRGIPRLRLYQSWFQGERLAATQAFAVCGAGCLEKARAELATGRRRLAVTTPQLCRRCLKPGAGFCGFCGLAPYCGLPCQQADRPDHRPFCTGAGVGPQNSAGPHRARGPGSF